MKLQGPFQIFAWLALVFFTGMLLLNSGSDEVLLMDAASEKYVPAADHPLIRNRRNG